MRAGQLALLLGAVAAVVLIAVLSGGGGDDGGGSGSSGAKAPKNALRISLAYSPEKEKLLLPLVRRFNAAQTKVGGRPVFVEASNVASGDAETRIARGRLKPTAWTPSSSLWGRLLNFEADQPYAPQQSPSIVRTPLVIAMWEPMAKALGYPKRKLGFSDVLRLARSKEGWAKYGLPEYGAFKLVHTNPDFSTSGLSAVVAEYYAATGKKEGLKESDVLAGRDAVRSIERSIVHYGDTTLFISDQLRKEGPGYASAVAMEEATLADFNRHRGSQPKLVAIYPREGTFYSDNPLITLDAPWVGAAQKRGVAAFGRFLRAKLDPRTAARFGFRPAAENARPAPPLTAANGIDPRQPQRVLAPPEPRVLAALKRRWRADRKPANVLLVLDTSGSMAADDRLGSAKSGLRAFLRQAAPQDRIGLTAFNDELLPLVKPTPIRSARARLQTSIQRLPASGGTAVWDATGSAVREVAATANGDRINAVVVLTDGEDTDSDLPLDRLVAQLRAQGDSNRRIRVFTIAYSAGASGAKGNLARVAAASGGKAYTGDTDDIESVYRSISSFF